MNTLALDTAPPATRRLADLPAPRGLPLLGHLHRLSPTRMHLQLEQWAREFGPVYRISLGGAPALVFHDAEAGQAVLRNRPRAVTRAGMLRPIFREMGADGLFSAEGDDWLAQRRLIMGSLNASHFRGFFPTIRAITERLHRRWLRAAEQGTVLEMTQELVRYTVDVTSALSFGEDPNTIEQGDNVIQRHLAAIFPMVMKRMLAPLPTWRWFKLPADRALDRHLAAVHAYAHERIAAARQRLAADAEPSPRNALEAMVLEAAQPGSGFTDATIVANVLTLLLGGEDTTAHALAWSLYHLGQDPALQRQLHEQAVAALGEAPVCATHEAVRGLDLFEAVASEAMRLKPVVALIGLEAREAMVVDGVEVPPRTRLFFLNRPAQLDARHFAGPDRFDPGRWLHTQEGSAHNPRAYLQFGAGPRVCPGRHLAGVELRLVLSMLLRQFEVELACEPAAVRELLHFTNTPDRMPVRLKLRQPRAGATPAHAATPAAARCPFGHA